MMRKTKKAPSRPKRRPARKTRALKAADLAQIERAAERLGAALAPAFVQPPAPQPVICTAPSPSAPHGKVPIGNEELVEDPAGLTCLRPYRCPGSTRAAFVHELIEGDHRDPWFVVFASGETLEFTRATLGAHVPKRGDAFVLYPDGHTAFLPRAEFNACYGASRSAC